MQRACGAAGFVPDIRARSSDFAVLTALVAAGAGAALVPRMALPETTAPLSLHPLVRPVSRTLFTLSRAGPATAPICGMCWSCCATWSRAPTAMPRHAADAPSHGPPQLAGAPRRGMRLTGGTRRQPSGPQVVVRS
ncbi:LysR substrate-binding domain-containing protein [Streptomyces asiaticus]|uniref:LysR substrate-binding domain-containing protein n=1 Tax=Streptomyces asiaticus TaxID=114695 RepID=UPI003D72D677